MKVIALIAAFIAIVTAAVEVPAAAPWGYEGSLGAHRWGKGYAQCNGKSQSPINIRTNQLASDGVVSEAKAAVEFTWAGLTSLSVELVNKGHTLQIQGDALKAAKTKFLGGAVYELLQVHMHTPSEHHIDGKFTLLELHFVHKNPVTGALAVVGVMFDAKTGASNGILGKIASNVRLFSVNLVYASIIMMGFKDWDLILV